MNRELSDYFSKQVYEIAVDYLFNKHGNDTCEELRAKIDAEVREFIGNNSGLSHYVVAMRGGNPQVWAWNLDDPNADAEFKMLTDQLTLDGQEWKGR